MYQSTTTSERLPQPSCERTESKRSILCAAASPAKTCHAPALEKALRTAMGKLLDPDYGESTHDLLTSLSQNGLWQKMYGGYYQPLLIDDLGVTSELFYGTWPTWGIMRNGRVTALKPLGRRTKGKEPLSWPTPRVGDVSGGDRTKWAAEGKWQTGLREAVNLQNWPTPQARDYRSGDEANSERMKRKLEQGRTIDLNDIVKWPTPTKSDYKGAGPTNIRKDGKNRANDRLDYAVYTPQGQLNADWVEILMGLPIGWTNVDKSNEELIQWPGWPASMNAAQNWATPNTMDMLPQRSPEALKRQFETTRKGRTNPANLREQILPENFPSGITQNGQYHYEPPRVTLGQKNRAKRLKCLGNGCVPEQVAPIFKIIMDIERAAK